MALPNELIIQRVSEVAAQAARAGWGERGGIYAAAAQELCISRQTLARYIKQVTVTKPRKRRADAGELSLSREEGMIISGYLVESARRNGKRLASLENAVEILRSNGKIMAGRVDAETGEFNPLSISAIRRSLYAMGLHPDQLDRADTRQRLASLHPNHVWQIDPSLCVLYYLRGESGLRAMAADEFYKNKPGNVDRISNDRVWRYVITDHTSGAFYVEYVLGAESGPNLANCFINAMQKRHESDPFSGVPLMVMVDPGSANTGAVFKNLCLSLGVEVQVNLPGKPWAKGQVEKTNDIVEREFEHGLKFVRVTSLDELNQECWRWMRQFNSTRTHSRTHRTRYDAWMMIRQEQLRIAPPMNVCRELAVTRPEERTVSSFLEVSYRGRAFDVSTVPGITVGEKLQITRNAFRGDDSAQVMLLDENGRQIFHVVDAVVTNTFGFPEAAAVIGKNFKSHKQTPAQKAKAEIEQLVMGAGTADEIKAKRKQNALPFGGEIDPYKPISDTKLPTYMPRKGTALDIAGPVIETPPLSHFAAAKRLKPELGELWTSDSYAWMQRTYPDGVREEQLNEIISHIRKQHAGTGLRVVGGA